MAANLFKRLWIPNPDGSDSTIPCTNANTGFFHSYFGDDSTGNGTRELPFKSYGRTALKSGITYINFRGVLNEYFSTGKTIIGDDRNQYFITKDFSPSYQNLLNLTTDDVAMAKDTWDLKIYGVNLKDASGGQYAYIYDHSLIKGFARDVLSILINVTVHTYYAGKAAGKLDQTFKNKNVLIHGILNVDTLLNLEHKYFVFSSSCIFKYNGVNVNRPTFTNDSSYNVELMRNSYIAAGLSIDKANYLFSRDSFGNETCKIILEEKDGGTHPNIFNKYNVDGTVADYTLNPNPLNEALHASDLGGYVGCFPAAITANNWGSIINVSADGSDDVVAGQLLQSDFTFSHASGQTWNRIQSAVEKIEKPGKFKGLNCDTLDGTPWGDYFGKKQNLVSDVALNSNDSLEPNTRYKVANTTDHSNYAIVIYKGVQYPPDFFFVTDATNLTFDLLNAGSGSVVRKVFATPLESGEIIPFDDYTTPSAFPRFSAPFMGDVLMLFHKIGANINQPVLFSEVTNDKMAYYANWAVTNADQEFVTLASDTVNYYYKIPVLTYYKKELNAHFDANYDQ